MLACLPTAFGGKSTLNSFSVFPERHRLFYLFYQVEIRYRQFIKINLPRPQPPTSTQLSCNYGNHMVDRLSPGDGSVESAGGKCRHVSRVPERRADAIRWLGLLALLRRLTATPAEPINFALIRYGTGMKAADCIRPAH